MCVSSLRVLCRQLKGNLFKTYSHCKMWIIFQHQTSELQKLGVQLDNVAKKADAATRERCHSEHQELTDCACTIEQKASERHELVTDHIDCWHQYSQQHNDVCAVLDEVESKLPGYIDITCDDVSVLRQQLRDCKDAGDKLHAEMPHINDAIEQGQTILQYVNSPHVHSQVNNLSDRVHSLTEKINTDTQRYLYGLDCCTLVS